MGHCVVVRAQLGMVDWMSAAESLRDRGCVRLAGAVDGPTCAGFVPAAPMTWMPVSDVQGSPVRQGGLTCGIFFEDAEPVVRDFGTAICDALDSARRSDVPVLPRFNEVTWGRSQDGVNFITPHRDPPSVGGVIAIVTLHGTARFRVWDDAGANKWETDDGDLVLIRGNGWPTDDLRCPVHEVESPTHGERMTMTLRHNRKGPGADYFG
jgi:hypothetical protein